MHRWRDQDLGRRIGGAIARARREFGWTQARLAEELEISVVHAGLLERGQRLPSLPTLILMAEVLGLSLDGLFLPDKDRGGRRDLDEVSRLVGALTPELRPLVIAFLRAGVAASVKRSRRKSA
ncbi:MAG: helix-turn-helix transcriptional regulator [Kofleriaceae bacterium]|nr:helix-turn-helix transcriptional regulator [Kofleriaceae bacterium]